MRQGYPQPSFTLKRTTADNLISRRSRLVVLAHKLPNMAEADWTSATAGQKSIRVPVSAVAGEVRENACSFGHIPVSLLADDPTLHREKAISEHGRMEIAIMLDMD